MKKILSVLLCSLLILLIAGCNSDKTQESQNRSSGIITDVEGNSVFLPEKPRIISCYASFTQCWILSGGSVIGITEDCIAERGMSFDNDVTIIGTTKSIDLEKVVSLSPDYVILSADLSAHTQLRDSLKSIGIPHGYFRVDTFDDYKNIMRQFTAVNCRDDLYEINVKKAEDKINCILDKIPAKNDTTALLIRAYSTGMKAKRDDNLAGIILREFGITNIADISPSILEDLSMEEIILKDPDYIFVITMGDEDSAKEYLKKNAESDPSWKNLSAVKNERYIVLPQELFHYKPNEKWGESYEYLAKIIFPQIF